MDQDADSAQSVYAFFHPTFQEYFAAKWFCDRNDWRNLAQHVTDLHWREVFLLAAETAKHADSFMKEMKNQITTLAISESNISYCLSVIKQKFSTVEALLELPEFQDCERIEAVEWLPVFRAICFEVLVEYVHNAASVTDLAKSAKEIDLQFALDFSQKYEFYKTYAIAISLKEEVGDVAISQLDTFSRLPFAIEINKVLNPVREPMQYANPSGNQLEILKNLINWWDQNGEFWNTRLKDLLFRHQDEFEELKMDDQALLNLRKYYDANKLLVDCLNSAFSISRSMRQEIENTLFRT